MEVILLERIEKLGQMGEVVNVKPGFARNYLLPQNKALRATRENREYFEARRAELEAVNERRRKEAEGAAGAIDGASVVLVRQASDSGQLYGSVRPRDIADALQEQGHEIERGQVKLDEPIKTIGLHTVRVALHPEVMVEITANVGRSEAEAELQAQGKSAFDQEAVAEEDVEEAAEEALDAALEAAEAEARAAGLEVPDEAEAETEAGSEGGDTGPETATGETEGPDEDNESARAT